MAVEAVTGAEPAWFCEWDDAPSRVLAHHWPAVPNFRDVTQIDWGSVPRVDILTGGYPCQPFSQAGQRKGTTDDRHLWPYVRDAIRVLRPRFVFLENVAGHRSMGFGDVLGDMAEAGLRVRWTSVRASDVGAPHHRERVFILATPSDASSIGQFAAVHPLGGEKKESRDGGSSGSLPGVHSRIDWGKYTPVIRRWERVNGPAPAPAELNSNGNPRLTATFQEWQMGLSTGHITAVPGLSYGDQIKMAGNGVCPQQGAMALRELLTMMEETI